MDLPSKKIIIASLFGIAILGTSLWNTSRENSGLSSYQKEGVSDKLAIVEDFTVLDSDNDGLKDWEEILWKTDPYNIDTDGDGVNDNQEIKQKRNPLISGPGNEEENSQIFRKQETLVSTEGEKTLTDIATQKLLFEYFDKKGEDPLSQIESASLIDSFSYVTDGQLNNFYKLSDIKTSASGAENLKKYGNSLGKIIRDGHANVESFSLLILYEAVEREDESKIKELDQFTTAYTNITEQTVKMSVPKEVQDIHLSILNDFNNLNTAIENMKTFFRDPLLGVLGVSQYQQISEKMSINFNNLNNFFNSNNIYFDQNESGDLFRQTIEAMK